MQYIDPKLWVRTWQAAAPRLDAIRRRELRQVDVADAVRSLSDAFDAARSATAPRLTSGLVEQQRLFGRLRG